MRSPTIATSCSASRFPRGAICSEAQPCATWPTSRHAPAIPLMRDPLYEALAPLAGSFANTTVAKPVAEHFLGVLATVMDDHDVADEHFAAAVVAHEKADAPLLVAETRVEWARLLCGTGATDRAAELLAEVDETAATYSAAFLQRAAAELRRALPTDPDRATARWPGRA